MFNNCIPCMRQKSVIASQAASPSTTGYPMYPTAPGMSPMYPAAPEVTPMYPAAPEVSPMYPGVSPMYPISPAGGQLMYPYPPIGTTLPTGLPTGPSVTPIFPAPGEAVSQPTEAALPPQTLQGIAFTPGYLKTQIGKVIRVEFLIGTNAPLVDRTGTLLYVGANYILIRLQESDDIQLCDLYSIKFITFFM